ncbi:MAG: MFS transporter [Ilumatobacteraceae bacterium]
MFGGRLDDSFAPQVRNNITAVTFARITANACYRFAPPFLAVIAKGFNISLPELGVAMFVSELSGLASPFAGRFVDRLRHRNAMLLGLGGTAAGALMAAVAPNPVLFAVGITFMCTTKLFFDLGLGAWIADHVAYERRSRIVGITESAWALGLLIGVSAMGVATALTSWRGGFALGAAGVAVMMIIIVKRVDSEPRTVHIRDADHVHRVNGRGWIVVGSSYCLMAASQCVFVTFGAWLGDEFGYGPAGIAAVGFGLGAVELFATLNSAKRTDAWGKERSIAIGSFLMVPAAAMLALGSNHLAVGLVAVGMYLMGFEFSIVSMLPVATQLVKNSPGTGMGWVLGGGTLGRASMSLVATAAYAEYGISAPALIGGLFALTASAAILLFRQLGGVHNPQSLLN